MHEEGFDFLENRGPNVDLWRRLRRCAFAMHWLVIGRWHPSLVGRRRIGSVRKRRDILDLVQRGRWRGGLGILLGVGLVRSQVAGPKPVKPTHLMPGMGRERTYKQ
jgi:hypothetical protein